MDYDAQREVLKHLMQTTSHTICYIRKDKELLRAIEDYCKGLEVKNSKDLNEKAYWMLHGLKDWLTCQCEYCCSRVSFRGLKKGYSIACCNSHAQIVARPKTIATNLKRFGSTTPLQSPRIREKINQHNIEEYGTSNVVESQYFKKKRIETCKNNFGVEYPMQSKEVQAKSREKCREKYGVEYVLQSSHAKAKGKETSQKLYGTDYPAQSSTVKAKAKKTFQDHYGVDAPAQCLEIRRKQQFRCEYKGINFDSTYEIAYYIWLVDHMAEFEYGPNVKFRYEFNGKEHFYMPDFKVGRELVEVKGDQFFKEDGTMQNPYDHSQDGLYEAKHQCMLQNNVRVIKTSEMEEVMHYIEENYGKGYLKRFRRHAKSV